MPVGTPYQWRQPWQEGQSRRLTLADPVLRRLRPPCPARGRDRGTEADRLSVDVLDADGQPRFVWDDLHLTGAEYTEVLLASVMERRRWRPIRHRQTGGPRKAGHLWTTAGQPPLTPQPMRSERQGKVVEKLLNVDEAAAVLGTSSRFPRRLIAERRIRFVRIGRHVRIPASALEEYVNSGTVQPVTLSRGAA